MVRYGGIVLLITACRRLGQEHGGGGGDRMKGVYKREGENGFSTRKQICVAGHEREISQTQAHPEVGQCSF